MTHYKHGRARDMRAIYRVLEVTFFVIAIVFVVFMLWFIGIRKAHAQDPRQDYQKPVPNELIVKFKPDVSAEDRAKLKHQFALQDKDILDSGSQVLVITDGTDVEKVKRLLKLDNRIERVEVNGYAHIPEEEHEGFVLPGR